MVIFKMLFGMILTGGRLPSGSALLPGMEEEFTDALQDQ
jgi:hypothetical protein